jgi:hypothetical protein
MFSAERTRVCARIVVPARAVTDDEEETHLALDPAGRRGAASRGRSTDRAADGGNLSGHILILTDSRYTAWTF